MVPKLPINHAPVLEDQPLLQSQPSETETANKLLPCFRLDYIQEPQLTEFSSSRLLSETKADILVNNITLPLVPTFYHPTPVPVPLPFWTPNLPTPVIEEEIMESHEVLKPTPVLSKDISNADELVSMSKLSIGENVSNKMKPSALSIKLLETSASRQSAFNLSPSISRPCLSQYDSNVINAV